MGKRLAAKWGGKGGEWGVPRQRRKKRRREGGRAGCWAKEAKRCWKEAGMEQRPPRDPQRAAWSNASSAVGSSWVRIGEELGGASWSPSAPTAAGPGLRSQEEGVGKEVAWKWGDGIHQGAATGVPPGILRCSIIGSPGSGAMGGSLGSGSHSAVPRGSLGSSSALPRGPLGSSSVMRRRSPASSDVTTPGPLGSVRAAWQGGALEGEGEHWDPEELSPTVTRGCPGLLGPSGSQCEAGIWQQVVEGVTCRHRRSSRIWSISTAGFNRI